MVQNDAVFNSFSRFDQFAFTNVGIYKQKIHGLIATKRCKLCCNIIGKLLQFYEKHEKNASTFYNHLYIKLEATRAPFKLSLARCVL